MLRTILITIASDINNRIELTKPVSKLTELGFKYCSWLLTLVGITYAAQTFHSRLLAVLSAVLSGWIFLPITQFISHHYNTTGTPRLTSDALFLIQLAFAIFFGAILSWRVRVIVDAIILSQH